MTQPTYPQQPQPPQPEPKKKRGFLKWIPLAVVLALASCGVGSAVNGPDTTAPPEASTAAAPASMASDTDPGTEPDPDSEEPAASPCKSLKKAQLRSIAEGFDERGLRLTRGEMLRLPEDARAFGMERIIAVNITGPGFGDGETAILAAGITGSDLGPITVVDNMAREFLTWGTAARKGSPMHDYQEELLVSDEASEVADCLEG